MSNEGAPSNGAARRAEAAHEHRARQFHALSDPTRLRILEWLTVGERCVCELQERMDAAQSRLSFHLKTLRDAGLITARRAGRWMFYRTVPAELEALAAVLGGLRTTSQASICGCGPEAELPAASCSCGCGDVVSLVGRKKA